MRTGSRLHRRLVSTLRAVALVLLVGALLAPPDTAPDCPSPSDDPECSPVLEALGLGMGQGFRPLVWAR